LIETFAYLIKRIEIHQEEIWLPSKNKLKMSYLALVDPCVTTMIDLNQRTRALVMDDFELTIAADRKV
jgi:hypothetical protein